MATDATPSARWSRAYLSDIPREPGIHHLFGVAGTDEIPPLAGTAYPENGVSAGWPSSGSIR